MNRTPLPEQQPPRTGRWDIGTVTRVALVMQALLILWRFDPELATNGDNALYYMLGRSLITAHGYRALELPGQPVEKLFPPLFPAMLALSGGACDNPVVAKVMVALLSLGCTLLLSHLVARRAPLVAAPVVLLSALSPLLVDYSYIMMSEVPFLFTTLLALLAIDAYEDRGGRWRLVLAAAAAVLPIACRSIGVAFSAAVFVHALLARRWRLALAHAAAVALFLGLMRLLMGPGSSYLASLLQADAYTPDSGAAGVASMLLRVQQNIALYTSRFVPFALVSLGDIAPRWLVAGAGTVLIVLIGAGCIEGIRGPHRLLGLYVPAYAAVLSLWQVQWSSTRFLVPLVPLLYLLAFQGVQAIGTHGRQLLLRPQKSVSDRPPGRTSMRVVWALAVLIVTGGAVEYLRIREPVLTPAWRNYYQCANWLRASTPPGTVVACRSPSLAFIRSQRPSVHYPFTADQQKFLSELRAGNVRYVIFDAFEWSGTTFRYVYPVLRSNSELFRIAYATDEPRSLVLEVVWP
jgi:hypothetical protein